MYKALSIIIAFGLISCGPPVEEQEKSGETCLQTVDLESFEAGMSGDVQLVDVRTSQEVADGYIEGAIVVDYRAPDFETEILKLSKDKPVYVYCRSGGRSLNAARFLEQNGYCQIYDLKGGITAWRKNGKEVKRD